MNRASGDTTERLVDAVGRPALTMVVDPSEDRHLLAELTVAAVAWWFVDLYLHGLLGEPVKNLGVKHRESALATVNRTMTTLKRFFALNYEINSKELEKETEAIAREVELLGPVVAEGGSVAGRAAVEAELVAAGVPGGEAKRLAGRLERVVWDGPSGRRG
jgi:hypothetical protein